MLALRRSLLKPLPVRGGDSPDFPYVGPYKPKRLYTLFDTNMWIYDGIQPEYLVDIAFPNISGSKVTAHCLMFSMILPFVTGALFEKFVRERYNRPFVDPVIDNPNSNLRKFLKDLKETRIGKHPHPLGH